MNRPITIDGTPVITVVMNLTIVASFEVPPYSWRYTAPRMPSGTAIKVAPPVDSNVPRIAGPIPGPALREIIGISEVKKSGKLLNITPPPREITDHSTATSGIRTATTAAAISTVMSWLFVERHDRLRRK